MLKNNSPDTKRGCVDQEQSYNQAREVRSAETDFDLNYGIGTLTTNL